MRSRSARPAMEAACAGSGMYNRLKRTRRVYAPTPGYAASARITIWATAMYVLKQGMKSDPHRRWSLPDRIFFGYGACHALFHHR